MVLEASAHARAHETFWLKSRLYPMTLKSSACANCPWIIREAERLERERLASREPSGVISAALDDVIRVYFARAVQRKAKP